MHTLEELEWRENEVIATEESFGKIYSHLIISSVCFWSTSKASFSVVMSRRKAGMALV